MGSYRSYENQGVRLRPREERAKRELERTEYTRRLKHEDVRFEQDRRNQRSEARSERRESREMKDFQVRQDKEERNRELDALKKDMRELKLDYDREQNPAKKEHLGQQIEINRLQQKNLLKERRVERFGVFKDTMGVFRGDEASQSRSVMGNRFRKLDNALHSLSSDPFDKINVNNLGIDGFGSKLFRFYAPKMDINEGFHGSFDSMFFGGGDKRMYKNRRDPAKYKRFGFKRYRRTRRRYKRYGMV